ncbi:hypothetical protein NX059_010825 [Plenodomus lindquistii]|nr:hypothetical protein NX059_010825 [Plenodomus lindquistii]
MANFRISNNINHKPVPLQPQHSTHSPSSSSPESYEDEPIPGAGVATQSDVASDIVKYGGASREDNRKEKHKQLEELPTLTRTIGAATVT